MRTIAVVGGGILGCLAALLAAERGWGVTLFEARDRLWTRASAANEGKLHLGPVFALGDRATHATMIRGAMEFAPLVDRAVGRAVDWDALATDEFVHLVMPDGLVDAEGLTRRYRAMNETLAEVAPTARYLHHPLDRLVDPLPRVDQETGLPSFRSAERAVHPGRLGGIVTAAVDAHPTIDVRVGARVETVDPTTGRMRGDGVPDEPFAAIVNCAWEEQSRLAGAREARNLRVRAAAHLAPVPGARCLTLVQGPFGDVVPHGDHVYASWYPEGRLSNTSAVAPSAEILALAEDPERIFRSATRQVAVLESLGVLPGGGRLTACVAGFVLGHGSADIDRRRSPLHRRGDFGVEVHGRLVSPRSFKLTTAPRAASLAVEALAEAT